MAILSHSLCGHRYPAAVEEGPFVLGLVGKGADALVGVVEVQEALGCVDQTAFGCDGLVQVVLLDPSGEGEVVFARAFGEVVVDVFESLEVDEAVHVVWQLHGGLMATGRT